MAAGDFEHLPYPSLPQSYTQSSHLAALAQLHGLTAPAAETARVLELGCASGGNIIPMAARFPEARFTGVDLSPRHITDGQRRIGLLGLNNIELRQGDVSQLTVTGERFDYIICHGLYSWVPPTVQQAILQLISNCLKPNGIAAISYNVLPGWHLRRVVRDICLQYAGTSGSPRERVARARQALDDIAAAASEANPFGTNLRQEAKRVARQPAAYILGEFLSDHNVPCTFVDFCNRAASVGMSFLCEGDLDASARQRLSQSVRLPEIPLHDDGGAVLAAGQALDFASGRPFRRSLLMHGNHAANAAAVPRADQLRGLHIVGRNKTCSVARVAEAFPGSIAINTLLAEQSDANTLERVRDTLLALVTSGQARVSTLPVRAGAADTARPEVSPLNRLEAAEGQPWITSLHHEAVPLMPLQALVVQHSDGKNSCAELAGRIAGGLEKPGFPQTPAQFVDATLAYLEREGVLES